MNAEQAKKLRKPFPANQVGKLPRVWCKKCSENKLAKHCDQHTLVKCNVCGNKITEAHLHLDYVGHAITTDRLLEVDPEWYWEPVAVGPNGEPLVVNGGLWIRLTIAGVTRFGFGDGGSVKEMIGDAIRNAAMRFGVALDLWANQDLYETAPATTHSPVDAHAGAAGSAGPKAELPPPAAEGEEEKPAGTGDESAASSSHTSSGLRVPAGVATEANQFEQQRADGVSAPATEAQKRLVQKLAKKLLTAEQQQNDVGDVAKLTKRGASLLIERLQKLEQNREAAA